MIRTATAWDLPDLMRMARAFLEATPYASIGIAESFPQLLLKLIDEHILLVADTGRVRGMAAVMLVPLYFNPSHVAASELFWWIDPDARGSGVGRELLDAIEAAAKERGAKTLAMISMKAMTDVEGVYLKRGYEAAERTFVRFL